jgi:hypothetical protein
MPSGSSSPQRSGTLKRDWITLTLGITSSTQGRFTSADSLGGTRLDPQSLNLYSYVLNNPLALIDPDGHSSETPCNFGGNGLCVGMFQDPKTSNIRPAKKPGDPFPVASCEGCGSPFGKIADVDVFDYAPASTTSDVLAKSVDLKPVLPPSWIDSVPIAHRSAVSL